MQPLHAIIEENTQAIVDCFVQATRERELPPGPMTRAELIDQLPRYLGEMAKALAARSLGVTESDAAAEHGMQRWHLGYDLKSVVLEYGALRYAVLAVAEEKGHAMTFDEFRALDRFLDVGIADAVVEYTEKNTNDISEALACANEATQARDEVVAIVAHDLKNPLTVIYGAVRLLLADISAEDLNTKRASLRDRLIATQRASDRMKQLIDDILDLARIKAGEMALKRTETTTGKLLRLTCAEASELAKTRSVQLVVEGAGDISLWCDSDRILQTLQNLVSNAIKFSPVGGTVTLRASATRDACVFEVCDSGPGIPPQYLPHLFDRFWRPSPRFDGHGLGLSIVKGIVELHGGSVAVASQQGLGSTFRLTLPKNAQP